jgi:glycerol dehydrogenase
MGSATPPVCRAAGAGLGYPAERRFEDDRECGMIGVFGAPGRYVQGPGALEQLGPLTAGLSDRPVVVVDADVLPLVQATLAASFAGRSSLILPFRGEVTYAAIGELRTQARAAQPDLVVGVGGGKALDAAKGVAKGLGAPFVAAPTIASNDSPTGRSMAIYDEGHTLVAIESLAQSPVLVVADTALIAAAPARFLRAGIGDAVAKAFEAERAKADGALNFFDGRPLRTALAIADLCYRTLREHGVAAMAAAEAHRPDKAFEAIVEANILMSGLAWENGGLSYAHAVVRGLAKARGAAAAAHGEHVAYGTLVQLAIEDRDDRFIEDLAAFYRSIGLPTRLSDLGMATPRPEEIAEIARLTTVGPQGGRIVVTASVERIAAAIGRIERLAAARA